MAYDSTSKPHVSSTEPLELRRFLSAQGASDIPQPPMTVEVLAIETADDEATDNDVAVAYADLPPLVIETLVDHFPASTFANAELGYDDAGNAEYEIELLGEDEFTAKIALDGELIEIERQINHDALPPEIIEWLNQTYGGAEIVEVEAIGASNPTVYEIKLAFPDQDSVEVALQITPGESPVNTSVEGSALRVNIAPEPRIDGIPAASAEAENLAAAPVSEVVLTADESPRLAEIFATNQVSNDAVENVEAPPSVAAYVMPTQPAETGSQRPLAEAALPTVLLNAPLVNMGLIAEVTANLLLRLESSTAEQLGVPRLAVRTAAIVGGATIAGLMIALRTISRSRHHSVMPKQNRAASSTWSWLLPRDREGAVGDGLRQLESRMHQ